MSGFFNDPDKLTKKYQFLSWTRQTGLFTKILVDGSVVKVRKVVGRVIPPFFGG